MSIDIRLHARAIESIFELLGTKENDITYSLGWALAQCDAFRKAFVSVLFPERSVVVESVWLQTHQAGSGITDVELRGPSLHVIIEAKRGWALPGKAQLKQYAARLAGAGREDRMLVTMSECSLDYGALYSQDSIDGIPVRHFSWNSIHKLSRATNGTHAEKRLLKEFRTYLERIVKMQNQSSNLVYVVSLGGDTPTWSTLNWQQFVNDRKLYFHPVGGNGWPKEPPNYIAFRYAGKLQTIHHVDDWKIVTDMDAAVPEIRSGKTWFPHFLYTLGEPIRPAKVVKTGSIFRNGRVWAMLDLLLTCETIAQARDQTKQRLKEE